jgi:hypothetical protein
MFRVFIRVLERLAQPQAARRGFVRRTRLTIPLDPPECGARPVREASAPNGLGVRCARVEGTLCEARRV